MLALSGVLFYFTTKVFAFLSGRGFGNGNLKKKLYLSFGNNTAEMTALLDTGNSLIDPVTLSPVIVAEYKFIKNLFNSDIRLSLDKLEDGNLMWIMNDIIQKGLPARLIPFSSLGKTNGILIGFIPDRVEIHDNCGVRVLDNCVVGISSGRLSKDNSYGALLNPYI